MEKKKSKAQNFADTLKDDPQAIIEWAEAEIKEYSKLIVILKKRIKTERDAEVKKIVSQIKEDKVSL